MCALYVAKYGVSSAPPELNSPVHYVTQNKIHKGEYDNKYEAQID